VTRLFLLVIFGLVASFYFPESRAVMTDLATPVLTPLFRMQGQHEMGEIAREVQVYERENYGRLPDSRRFTAWLDSKFAADAALDPWGGKYTIVAARDSFAILSWGPDGLPRNVDDLRTARRRSRPGGR